MPVAGAQSILMIFNRGEQQYLELKMEGNLQLALKMFGHYNCKQQTLVSKQTLINILNKQALNNIHTGFNAQIIEQIWGQAEATSKGEVTTFTFSKIYVQAISILEERIRMIDGPTGMQQNQENLILQKRKLATLQEQYKNGYSQNQDLINTTQKNIVALQTNKQVLQKNRQDFQKELDELKACLQIEEKEQDPINQIPQIVKNEEPNLPNAEVPSQDLSWIFKASVIGVCAQFAFMSFHFSFLALLCYLLVVYWLFLGYYDRNFVKILIASLIVACLMDIIYICLFFMNNIGSYRYCDLQTGWRYVSIAILILEFFLRVFLMMKLSLFKQPIAKKYFFMLFNHEIELKARSGKFFSEQNQR